jgi:glycosyltransferase involved in cell wall biosynthesis
MNRGRRNTKPMILFSVLIPVYNVEKYLGRCIYSVLEQTYPYYEIILIDDGSEDSSGAICDRYAKLDDRIRVHHQKNQGLVTARIQGMDMATGDYYLFLDGDDYWDSDLLDTIYNAIRFYDCDMVIYNFKRVTQTKSIVNPPVFENGTIFEQENKVQLFEEVITGNRLNQIWAKAVSRNIIDYREYSKYSKHKHAEDLLLSLPLLYNAKRILYLNKPMYNYRMTPNGITHTFHIHKVKDITYVWGKLLNYLDRMNMKQRKHLKQFYETYTRNLLYFIVQLCQADANYQTKVKILENIQKFKLYQNAIPYMRKFDLSYNQKILSILFQRKYYIPLFLYVNILIRPKRYLSDILNGGQ